MAHLLLQSRSISNRAVGAGRAGNPPDLLMDSSDSESNLFVDHDFVTWKMVHAAKKVPEQVAWDPSFAKREFLLEYVLQASPAGATLAGWDT